MTSLLLRISAIALLASVTSGCLVKRTVTVGGRTVEDGYAIKRPVKEAIENSQG